MPTPELINRLAAVRPGILTVIVNDNVPSDRQLAIEIGQSIHRGLVVVAVQTHHSELLDRGVRKRILKPTLQEFNLVVEQPISGEIFLTSSRLAAKFL